MELASRVQVAPASSPESGKEWETISRAGILPILHQPATRHYYESGRTFLL
jgi:hypothetical protein